MQYGANTKPHVTNFDVVERELPQFGFTHLRIFGGTYSMQLSPYGVTTEEYRRLKLLADKCSIRYVLVLNTNGRPAEQFAWAQLIMNTYGLPVDYLELGNEQYLPKFAQQGYDLDAHLRCMAEFIEYYECWEFFLKPKMLLTAAYYTADLPLPRQEYRAFWNQRALELLRKYRPYFAGITLHIYQRGLKEIDLGLVQRLRYEAQLTGHGIFVTECGILSEDPIEQRAAATNVLIARLAMLLNTPEHMLLVHILFNSKEGLELLDNNGVTPIGQAVLGFKRVGSKPTIVRTVNRWWGQQLYWSNGEITKVRAQWLAWPQQSA